MKRASLASCAVATGTLALVLLPAHSAQADEVSPTGKGIVGTALLGAEVVTMTEAIIDVRAPWLYAVGAGAGAIGGGIGGYFIEQSSSDGRVPLYLLGGGLALVIPAVVLTLNATRYRATAGAREDKPTGPPPDPGAAGGTSVIGADPSKATPADTTTPPATTPPATTPAPAPPAPGGGGATPPLSLVDVNAVRMRAVGLRMGLPTLEVRNVFTDKERRQFGMSQISELRVPVVHVTF